MNSEIKFTKMQGLGNDFIIVDFEDIKHLDVSFSELSRKMCDRKFGIGADGLIITNPEDMKADTDASWRIFNSDGSQPQMCGNGIRCFAKYLFKNKLVKSNEFTINTLAGIITPKILDNNLVKVNMGIPVLKPELIPFKGDRILKFPLQILDKKFEINAISMGNPHCVIFTEESSKEFAEKYGSVLEKHELFPEKTNVEFISIISKTHIKINVWERGCGITLACGTGACASVVAGILNNLTENNVTAELPGGCLNIEWQGKETDPVFMSGPAEFVFYGNYIY
ncbi:MAG: diaminopimelate epimerase [Candidatus Gastranaerophilaceae bacterium]|jgi:diaminopimelate epimerase